MKLIRKMTTFVLALACFAALAGCSATQFSRGLEDAIGSMARTKVQTLGSPDKQCDLVLLNISKAYAVVLPKHILRLGEEYPQVSVAKQFSGSGVDYAVLQCARADSSVENYLLQILSSARVELYKLDSKSMLPFTTTPSGNAITLMQDTDTPGQIRYWTVAPSSVRGPSLSAKAKPGSGKSARSKKKAATRKSEPAQADLPVIQQDTSVRLEDDTSPQESAPVNAPPASDTPIIILDNPAGSASEPQGSAEPKTAQESAPISAPSTGGIPIIVLDKPTDSASEPQGSSTQESAPAKAPTTSGTPIIVLDKPAGNAGGPQGSAAPKAAQESAPVSAPAAGGTPIIVLE